jgi:hypothetical protein
MEDRDHILEVNYGRWRCGGLRARSILCRRVLRQSIVRSSFVNWVSHCSVLLRKVSPKCKSAVGRHKRDFKESRLEAEEDYIKTKVTNKELEEVRAYLGWRQKKTEPQQPRTSLKS